MLRRSQTGTPRWRHHMDTQPMSDVHPVNITKRSPMNLAKEWRSDVLAPHRVLELDKGYAATAINTAIFRHHGVVSHGDFQFASYYASAEELVIVRRDLRDDSIQSHRLPGKYNVRDAHNVACLGVDANGFLHLSYDHQAYPLNYRRSRRPLDVSAWTEPLGMTGREEQAVTYPYFLQWPASGGDVEGRGDLGFMYRAGAAGNGDLCLKRYDAHREVWTDMPEPILRGRDQSPWTASAYWNHPAFDSRGRMVLTWIWNVNRGGPPDRPFWWGHLLGYAASPDGRRWFTSQGLELSLPMTPANNEVIWTCTPGCNLINQCSSAIDSRDRLHVVMYSGMRLDDAPQYRHLWFDGDGWRCDTITSRTVPFSLLNAGKLGMPISRPQIVIDHHDNVYAIYQGDLTEGRMIAQRLEAPDYAPPGRCYVLWDEPLGDAEPIVDVVRWRRDGVLSMLIQPAGPRVVPVGSIAPLRIVEWKLPD